MTSGRRTGLTHMQTTTLDLGPQHAEVARIVAGVRDDQLRNPTPCTEMNVAAQIYGPVVPVPDDAPVLDRLLGQSGRAPSWTSA